MILESNEATKKYGGKTAVDHVSLNLDENGRRTCKANQR